MLGMREIIMDPDAPLVDQVRCISALFTLHAGMFVLQDLEGDPEEKRQAVLEVAIDLVTQAHEGAERPRNRSALTGRRSLTGRRQAQDASAQTVTPLARRKATGSTADP